MIAMGVTAEKAWDLLSQSLAKSGTVERSLKNLGKVKITAAPGEDETIYLIEIEKPILNHEFFIKLSRSTALIKKELELFGGETTVLVMSPYRMRINIPSTTPTTCTEFMNFVLRWLNSTVVKLNIC